MYEGRILVVEDENIVGMDLAVRLTTMGYRVIRTVSTGSEAVQVAVTMRPDVVLMDIMLKGEMDGITAAAEIRRRADIPIIYTTAHSDDNTLRRARVTEPFGYIVKPYTDRDLLSAIEMALYRHRAEQRLRESETTARALLSIHTDAAALVDPRGIILDMNEILAKQLGKPKAELIGCSAWSLFPRAVSERRAAVIAQVAITRLPVRFEEEYAGRCFDTVIQPIGDERSKVARFAIVARDMTENKRVESALRRAKDAWEQTFDAVPDLLFTLDKNHRITRINRAAVARLGVSTEQVIGQTCYQCVHGIENPLVECPHSMLLADGKEHFAEVIEKRLGGVFLVSVTPLYDENGALSGSVHVARDITEFKRIQEALAESESKLRNLVDQATDGIAMCDEQGMIVTWNSAAEKLTGVSRGEALGRPLAEIQFGLLPAGQQTPEASARIRSTFEQALVDRQASWLNQRWEIEIQRSDGTCRYVEQSAFGIQTSKGIMLASLSRDITERKKAEDRLLYLSTHDTLTGLYNRSFFEAELARMGRGREFPITIVMVDVNGMKKTNDTQGHSSGDELLCRAARVLTLSLRAEDVVARVGGDEFAILLPNTDVTAGEQVLARIKDAIERDATATSVPPLSFALGAATAAPGMALIQVLKQADKKMYEDKMTARDKLPPDAHT